MSSFAGRPFFFAAPKGERSIIDELDATIDRINQSNPQLQETLYKKHFLPSEDNYDLTSAELRYARNYKTLRVASSPTGRRCSRSTRKPASLKGLRRVFWNISRSTRGYRSKW